MLNRQHGLHLGLEEVLYTYSFKQHNLEKCYLIANAKSMQLVTNLPTTSKNKSHDNVLLFGALGCVEDTML